MNDDKNKAAVPAKDASKDMRDKLKPEIKLDDAKPATGKLTAEPRGVLRDLRDR